ncbi:MAG TPA: ATP synthase F1 subunit delta [Terriglobales bacterium]|jgi:F-type H+-transporting ATPase subunit delta
MASVTNTYARAFVDVVFDRQLDAGRAARELYSLAQLVASSKPLREVWQAPSIPPRQKRGLLDAIVAREGISREVRNFIAVLMDHRRMAFLGAIVKEFEQEMDRRLGFAEAEVITARELGETERRALEAQVEKLSGKKVRPRYSRDESLRGGAVVKLGSTIYDGSVKGRLERLREQLAGSN